MKKMLCLFMLPAACVAILALNEPQAVAECNHNGLVSDHAPPLMIVNVSDSKSDYTPISHATIAISTTNTPTDSAFAATLAAGASTNTDRLANVRALIPKHRLTPARKNLVTYQPTSADPLLC